jgi:hypothetical protein
VSTIRCGGCSTSWSPAELPGDLEVALYVADLLIDILHVDHLYRVRDARGKRLEEVAEMLVESNPLLGASSF